MRFGLGLLSFSLLLPSVACGGDDDADGSEGNGGATGGSATGGSATGGATGGSAGGGAGGGEGGGGTGAKAGGGPCPSGVTCFDAFPFYDDRDTAAEGVAELDVYACKLDSNEGGPEIVYRATVPADGFLSAVVRDGDGVDIDVQILATLDPDDCLDRGDTQARADVPQGDVWIVADSWVNASGTALAGAYAIDIGFVAASDGGCDMQVGEMPRVGDGGNHLAMPAIGPVVQEAHLVTDAEPPPFPSSASEELDAHLLLTQDELGFVMDRTESWAPLEGGGTFFGAGIGDPADLPVLHEAYYVNMFWTAASRPPPGTRMILRRPDAPERAVVVAAGYETGPSNLANIAGTTEETHFYLGTAHLSELELGIAEDQTLPIGPRRCR